MSLLFLFAFRSVGVCLCQVGSTAEEPQYILNFDSPIYVCPDEDSRMLVDTSEIEVHRYNDSATYLSGVIKLLKNLERHTVLELLVEKESSGRYELTALIEICDVCDEIENPQSFYSHYMKILGFLNECPIDSKAYELDNFVSDTNGFPINSDNAGRYQATINFYHNPSGLCKDEKTFLGCLKLDFVIEPM